MSGKVKSRTAANAADAATQSVNERILKECHTLYIDPENGMDISLGLERVVLFWRLCNVCLDGDSADSKYAI